MNCINCFHYGSCSSVDVTGYVRDFEHEEELCEHFITPDEVHPTTKLVIKVDDYGFDSIFVKGVCARCGANLTIKRYNHKEWDEYYKDNYSVETSNKFCPRCGAKIVEEENGTT